MPIDFFAPEEAIDLPLPPAPDADDESLMSLAIPRATVRLTLRIGRTSHEWNLGDMPLGNNPHSAQRILQALLITPMTEICRSSVNHYFDTLNVAQHGSTALSPESETIP